MLHSHGLNYHHGGGSGQQQVTCAGVDDNDLFIIRSPKDDDDESCATVAQGMEIKLIHKLSNLALHSHSGLTAPTSGQQEVTCFQWNEGVHDNDNWRVEYEGDRFRLIHVATDHSLHSHSLMFDLGNGDSQQEVSCFEGRDDNDWWTVEQVVEEAPVCESDDESNDESDDESEKLQTFGSGSDDY